LPSGAQLFVLKDWMDSSPYLYVSYADGQETVVERSSFR